MDHGGDVPMLARVRSRASGRAPATTRDTRREREWTDDDVVPRGRPAPGWNASAGLAHEPAGGAGRAHEMAHVRQRTHVARLAGVDRGDGHPPERPAPAQ